MNVAVIETLHCDAGWCNDHVVKLTADDGAIGWSEFDEGVGSPGVTSIIERMAGRLIGQPVGGHERLYAEMFCKSQGLGLTDPNPWLYAWGKAPLEQLAIHSDRQFGLFTFSKYYRVSITPFDF